MSKLYHIYIRHTYYDGWPIGDGSDDIWSKLYHNRSSAVSCYVIIHIGNILNSNAILCSIHPKTYRVSLKSGIDIFV